MSDDTRSPIIKPALDATGVRAGADEVKKAARDMATAVGAEGRRAGQGAEGIGEGARRGADRTEAETRRMVAAIQRVQAEVQAGSRNSSAYFEAIARQRGVDVAQLQPYLDGLKAAETAQKGATAGLNAMGMTARQTTAALRQVPAQFTDIVTGLASGQQPLMVLLQQGGQLKDVFGGAGAAARALGGYVASLLTPFTLLAGAGAAVAAAFVLGSKESQAYAAALAMSGNAAGTTASQLGEMARAIDAVSGATQGKAAEVLTQLAAAGDVGAQNLQRFARAAIELERAGGPAAEQTARAFSELARSPLQASLKLTESMRYLSAATFEQIAQLERQGRATEAARVAQDAYAAALEQRAPQMVERLGYVERAWQGIKDLSKEAWDAILNVGRPETMRQQLDAINAAIGVAQRLQGSDGGGLAGRLAQAREQSLIAQRDLLLEQIRLTDRAAQAAGQRARTEQANIVWLQGQAQYMDRTARLALEVNKIREQGLAAGRTEEEIAERIRALVQQTYGARTDTGENAAARERERALERQARLLAELSGLTASYQQDLAALDAMRRAGNISEERYGELVRELVARQPIVRQGAQEAARAAQEQARAVQALRTQYEAYLQGLDRTVGAGEKLLAGLRSEYIALTAGKQVRDDLQLVELERLAVAYEHALVTAELNDQERVRYERLLAQTREEILLRRGIMSATAGAEARRANERAAEEAARQWQQASEQISQSLADALMRGGRNAAEYLRGLFRTMVFKPLLEQAVKPFTEYVQAGMQWLYGAMGAGAGTGGAGSGGGAGASAGAAAQGMSSYAGWAALFAAGISQSSSDYAKGWRRDGLDTALAKNFNWLLNPIYSTLVKPLERLGLISGKTADILGGDTAIARMFGRKPASVTAQGVVGTFGAGGFQGQAFADWFAKGGWFRSDKSGTNFGALDAAIAKGIQDSSRQVYQQAQEYARVLGLPLERLSGVTAAARIQLGDDAEANRQAVAEALQAYGAALAESFQVELSRYGRAWETTLETFQRLAGLQQFSRDLSALGGVFGRVATLAVDTREQLIDFAGGMDALRDQALSFVQQYYSRDEIAGLKAREIQSVLQALGITQDVNSRDQFRALVDNTDVGSEAGRRRLAQLLAIGGEFADLADYLSETGSTLSSTAALAPAGGQLAELFAQPAQAQVEAINNVVAGVLRVELAIERLTEAVQADRTIVLPNSWEVSPP